MKHILTLTLSFLVSNASPLTTYQTEVVNLAIKIGKPYDLSNTLAGIVMVESQAGIYKVNPTTEDYGVTGVNIHSLLRRVEVKDNYMNRSKYATYLVTDDRYALRAALSELVYWRDSRKRYTWYRMVGSYNQGNTIQSNEYAQKVARAIQKLKQLGVIK